MYANARTLGAWLVALGLCLGARVGYAQQNAPEPSPVAARACPPPVPCPTCASCPEPEPCDGDALAPAAYWRKAMQWIGGDREDEGRMLLRDLKREYPDDPQGLQAAAWLADHEDRVTDGRAEFIIGSTLMGAYFGYTATLGIYDDILSDEAWKTASWMSLGGGLVGLGASALASRWMNISESQALLYNFAGSWGFTNGFLVYDLIWPLDGNDALVAGASGMGIGLVTALSLWPWLDVDEGAAQMSTSMGAYALEFAVLGAFLAGDGGVFRDSEAAAILGVLVPANAAVVGGFFLGKRLKWSADDVRYVGLGGILGNLLGAAILVSARPDSVRTSSGIQMASVLSGLVAGALIVRPWETPSDQATRDRVPLTAGILHVDEQGLHVRPPMPTIVPTEYRGQLGYTVDLTLLTSTL